MDETSFNNIYNSIANDIKYYITPDNDIKPISKSYSKDIYEGYKLTMRILRKVKYN